MLYRPVVLNRGPGSTADFQRGLKMINILKYYKNIQDISYYFIVHKRFLS